MTLRPLTSGLSDAVALPMQYLRRSRVLLGLARVAATAPIRQIDSTNPDSWEFSAFSAAGEDGIIDHLSRQITDPNHTFLEIGASDGVANNTAWLAIGRKWAGTMVEADSDAVKRARSTLAWFNPLVAVLEMFVTAANVGEILRLQATMRPDVFSLDVDSVDYYIADALFAADWRPRICVVEYNSAFGPERACTVKPGSAGQAPLYYGVSISGWRRFFSMRGYQFIGVERTGVNAFFVDPDNFDPSFLAGIRGRAFGENLSQLRREGGSWEQQSRILQNHELVDIP